MDSQIFRLESSIIFKNIFIMQKMGKLNKYETNELSNMLNLHSMFENNRYENCTHWEQLQIDSELVNDIMNTSQGYGNPPPPVSKRAGMAISYGMIVFYWDQKENKEYYLISQRRDSIPYADFVRGRYKIEYLPRYFSLMTNEERNMIMNYNFDDIWDDMHMINKGDIKNEQRARKCWYKLYTNKIIELLLKNTKSDINSPEWEFPKGRRMKDEHIIQCALREFEEETGIAKRHLILLRRNKPFIDTFYGSNDKLYQTIYFPALIKRKYIPEKQYDPNIIRKEFISQEISEIKFVSFDELSQYIDSRKLDIIVSEFRPWIYENINDKGFMRCGIRKNECNYNCHLTI